MAEPIMSTSEKNKSKVLGREELAQSENIIIKSIKEDAFFLNPAARDANNIVKQLHKDMKRGCRINGEKVFGDLTELPNLSPIENHEAFEAYIRDKIPGKHAELLMKYFS